MKFLVKNKVCGSYKQYTGPTEKDRNAFLKKKKKKKKKAKTQNVDADVVSTRILRLSSSVEFSR